MSSLPLWCDIPLFILVFLCLLGYGNLISHLLIRGLGSIPSGDPDSQAILPFLGGIGLGSGFVSLLVLEIGAAGLLYQTVLIGVLITGLIFYMRGRRDYPWQRLLEALLPDGKVEVFFGLMAATIFFFHLDGCFLPVTGQDELTYHLTMPRQYLVAHRIYATPNLLHGNFPYNAEMLYTFCLALGSGVLCKLLHWFLFASTCIGILAYSRKLCRGAGYLSLLLYLVAVGMVYVRSPMEAGSDVPCALYLILGLYFIGCMTPEGWKFPAVMAGILNGLAWGTKYVAPAFITPPLILCLVGRGLQQGFSIRQTAGILAIFLLLTLGLFAPWMAKNALCTGNPLYPMFSRLFPSPAPYDAIAARLFLYEEGSNFYNPEWQKEQYSHLTSPLSRIYAGYREKLKWSLNEGDYLLVLSLALSMAGLVFALPGGRPLFIAGLFVHLIFLFIYGAHINRFFSVSYPLLAVICGIVLDRFFAAQRADAILRVLVGVVLLGTAINLQTRWCGLVGWNGIPLLTEAAQEQRLERYQKDPSVKEFWKQLPEHVPEGAFILGHGVRYPYSVPRRIYCVCDYEEELLSQLKRELEGWDGVAKRLHDMGFTHLILAGNKAYREPFLSNPLHSRQAWPPPAPGVYEGWPPDSWLEAHTRLIATGHELELRELNQP